MDGCVSVAPSAVGCGRRDNVPSGPTRKLSFSTPRNPWRMSFARPPSRSQLMRVANGPPRAGNEDDGRKLGTLRRVEGDAFIIGRAIAVSADSA
jgi:hypothetical protein